MNFKRLILIAIFAVTPPLYAAPPITDMTAHEILRARQACERSQPRAVCIEMEQARYQELQEQRVREALQRKRELQRERHEERRDRRDRDNDRDRRDWDEDRDRRDNDRDRDDSKRDRDEARAHYCRTHPEICEAQRREQEERATQQAWCERKFSRQQCLEMRERNERKPSRDVPNRRGRDDQRTRDIDRRDRRELPRVIEPREESPYNRPYRRPAQD